MSQTTRPRQVSFSDTLPSGLAMTLGGRCSRPRSPPPKPTNELSTPPPPSSRPYVRSPYVPTHARGESVSSVDVFGDSPGWDASASFRDTDGASDGEKENRCAKGKSVSPPFSQWGVPRSPGNGEASSSPSPSPSPSPRRNKQALQRLDFSRTSTPLTARKLFTPRILADTPTKVRGLGRKISLHGIGHAFASPPAALVDSDNEDHSFAPMAGTSVVLHDEDEVDLALGLNALSMPPGERPSTPKSQSSSTHYTRSDKEPLFLPHSPTDDRDGSPFPSPHSPADLFGDHCPITTSHSPHTSHSLHSFHSANSSAPSPPTKLPSMPITPARATGVDSDDSDHWVPRTGRRAPPSTRAANARRVVLSDDEDSPSSRPVANARAVANCTPGGLRGRVPAAIRCINEYSSEDENERFDRFAAAMAYLGLEAEVDDDAEGGSHNDTDSDDEVNETMGSLREFIVDDGESDHERSESEAEDSYEEGAVSEGSLRDNWRRRARPRASRVYRPGRYDNSEESIGSLRRFIEGDTEGVDDSDSYAPTNTSVSRPSGRSLVNRSSQPRGGSTQVALSVAAEVIEILDSSEDEVDAVCAGEVGHDVLVVDSSDEGADELSDDNAGILHFSPPPRPVQLPNLEALSLYDVSSSEEDEPRELKPSKTTRPLDKAKRKSMSKNTISKKQWETYRMEIAQEFFDELDRKVFDRKLGKEGAKATLEWSAHLRTSAGNAHRKTTRRPDGTTTATYKINLSVKVLTTKQQILDTLAHEMCHLAQWIISNEFRNPHGRVFRSWGAKVMRARPDIAVTTKHSYEIEYKYSWKCTNGACAKVYNRHSKSIDTARHACGVCKSRLEPCFETKTATGFQAFLKNNMKAAKAAMPAATHGEVMRALSKRWTDCPEGDHVAYWGAMT